MFDNFSEGIKNRSSSNCDEDIGKLIIKIAANDGLLDVRRSFSIFVVKSNAIENVGQDQNDCKKQNNRKIAIHEVCNIAAIQGSNPGHARDGSCVKTKCTTSHQKSK
mmetsp:Transcript_37422/g.79871  ORF Transcript_37422/g.79871 Transcript_37422/m.79871 type:complete len:107 (-) Transcript_37422:771-1091(-)